MTTTTITIKQASQSVNKLATDFMEHETLDAKLLEIVTASLTSEEHLHIRDYLLGMPIDFGTGFMIQFAEAIHAGTPEEKSYAIKTVLAAFYYENSQTEKAYELLDSALAIKGRYALAELLKRVIGAGWEVDSFVQMRSELHPKVIRAIQDDADKEL